MRTLYNSEKDRVTIEKTFDLTIQDYLWSEQTGLPETYSEEDVRDKTEAVFVHVFRAHPTAPSPCYASMASYILPDKGLGCVIGRPPSTTHQLYAYLRVDPSSLAKNRYREGCSCAISASA